MSRVRVAVDLDEHEASELALWLKRLCFEDWLQHTDAFQTKEQRVDQAYRFRDATMKVDDALADARGTRPR